MNVGTTSYEKIIIIGSGPAGYTSAIYTARANLRPLLITGLQKGGQLIQTDRIENWPGRFKNVTGIELMLDLENHARALKTKIIQDCVSKINICNQSFELICDNHHYHSRSIIIATGSSPKYLGLKNEKKFLGHGVSTCATCDGFFYKNKNVAVVGGGNTAIEEVLYLSNIASKVYLIHRKNTFTAEKILIQRLHNKIKQGNIILYTQSVITDIIGDTTGISSININNSNNIKKNIIISGLFIAIGSVPNTAIFQNIIDTRNGYIQMKKNVQNYTTQTNIPGIFAAGDVVDNVYKQAITSAGSGCMAAIDAERYLSSLNF